MQANADIAIVGAGAAGLAAAIFAAEARTGLTIMLLDGARTIGAKILVSGGGRCNVTNAIVHPSDFHAPPRLVARILRRFTQQDAIQWFESLGVECHQEPSGKLFPSSNKARTVLNALIDRCQKLDVRLVTQHRIQTIAQEMEGFRLQGPEGLIYARRVVLATGGRSLPKSGSDGHGWTIARQLGHHTTLPCPALVPLVLDKTFIHTGLSGISHEVGLTITCNKRIVDHRVGSLLWTHFGISGPVVLDASRFWVMANWAGEDVTISLSCFPHLTIEEVDKWLSSASRLPGRKTVLSFLSQPLPLRLAEALCSLVDQYDHHASSTNSDCGRQRKLAMTPLNQLSQGRRKSLVRVLMDLSLPVINHRGWNFAEVTAGGIPLSEINPKTMMSRKVPGLYVIGEMLDCDGRIGGFNFQWAWSTGFIAGRSVAGDLTKSLEEGKRWLVDENRQTERHS